MINNLLRLRVCLTFLILIILPSIILAESINYLSDDFQTIANKSKQQNKHFFVKFSADWCATCKVMDKNSNNNATLVSFANENFIAVEANIDQIVGEKWIQKFNVCCLPTVIAFSPDGKEVARKEGGIPSSEFLSFLENVINKPAVFVSSSITETKKSYSSTIVSPPVILTSNEGSTSSKWTLLIGKYTKIKDANKRIKELQNEITEPVFLSVKKEFNIIVYHVGVGNFSQKEEVSRLRKKLLTKNIRSTVIQE